MLKCIAIDDEPLALRQLQGYIAKINFLKLEKAFTNAIEAQQYLAGNPIDLIFVDINMPDLSGVEFVRSLVSRPMIIFTTAYSEYAVEGFKLDAIDYLLKPFSFADFNRSVTKAQSLYELLAYRKTQGDVPAPEATPRDREYISIKADYKTTLVRISDIVYLESEGEYVRLHLDDRSTITTLFRLKNMEAALPSEMFMRVHRSYIVNLQRIRSYVKGRVFISDSEYVPIGENYREAFQRYIEAHYPESITENRLRSRYLQEKSPFERTFDRPATNNIKARLYVFGWSYFTGSRHAFILFGEEGRVGITTRHRPQISSMPRSLVGYIGKTYEPQNKLCIPRVQARLPPTPTMRGESYLRSAGAALNIQTDRLTVERKECAILESGKFLELQNNGGIIALKLHRHSLRKVLPLL